MCFFVTSVLIVRLHPIRNIFLQKRIYSFENNQKYLTSLLIKYLRYKINNKACCYNSGNNYRS